MDSNDLPAIQVGRWWRPPQPAIWREVASTWDHESWYAEIDALLRRLATDAATRVVRDQEPLSEQLGLRLLYLLAPALPEERGQWVLEHWDHARKQFAAIVRVDSILRP